MAKPTKGGAAAAGKKGAAARATSNMSVNSSLVGRIKTFLAQIKENVLDPPDVTVHDCWAALWQLELAQRGVLLTAAELLQPAPSSTETASLSKLTTAPAALVTHLTATAGKPLYNLESSGLPAALLAGAAAVAGRVAERTAQFYSAASSCPALSPPLLPSSAWTMKQQQVFAKHCKDVKEQRFGALLELLLLAQERASTNNASRMMALQVSLARVAEGAYLRAAVFQPDAPPMWKRAWDMVLLPFTRSNTPDNAASDTGSSSAASSTLSLPPTTSLVPWQVTTAVCELRRIAASKQKTQRVEELNLILAQAALQGVQTSKNNNNSVNPDDRALPMILRFYVEPHRPLQATTTSAQMAQEALQYLQDVCADKAAPTARLLVPILRLEAHLLLAANSSSSDASSDVIVDEETVVTTARQVHQELCQQVVSPTETAEGDPARVDVNMSLYVARGWKSLRALLDWMRDDLQGAQKQRKGKNKQQQQTSNTDPSRTNTKWNNLAALIREFLLAHSSSTKDVADTIVSHAENYEALLQAASLVPCVMWCHSTASSMGSTHLTQDVWVVSEQVLAGHYEQASKTLTQAMRSTTQVSSDATRKLLQQRVDQIQLALVASQCQQYLMFPSSSETGSGMTKATSLESTTLAVVRLASRAIEDSTSGITEMAASYGTFVLASWILWGGWFHTPWQELTTKERRSLIRVARDQQDYSRSLWGRHRSGYVRQLEPECLLLDICWADSLSRGAKEAVDLFQTGLSTILEVQDHSEVEDVVFVRIMQAYALRSIGSATNDERLVEDSITILQDIDENSSGRLFPYQYNDLQLLANVVRCQRTAARQHLADVALRAGRWDDAQAILEAAVAEDPADAETALSLGTFFLRRDFFPRDKTIQQFRCGTKTSQMQLLRAAKLDSKQASPFALLGYWYESQGDLKRATGCYSKALLLDAAHPVAGRGLLRLTSSQQSQKNLERALESTSPLSGWAWHAVGVSKLRDEGNCDLAVVALLKAARCRDVERPSDPQSWFYAGPQNPQGPNSLTLVAVLTELAQAYRTLGRYTASIRTYHAAISITGKKQADSTLLYECAQVEVQLALFDEAVESFTHALKDEENRGLQMIATLGLCSALLSIAQRDVHDGKAGAALQSLKHGLEQCSALKNSKTVCLEKLRGDMHSFGAALPIRAFGQGPEAAGDQISFVAAGAKAYANAQNIARQSNRSDLEAELIADGATNILLCAQLSSVSNGDRRIAADEYRRAAVEFRRALERDPLYGRAWCGLGCATRGDHPLLAQHAFCRAIELDALTPDAYANLSFLYTVYGEDRASSRMTASLTEVADTPMTWINLGFLFQRQAVGPENDDKSLSIRKLREAADAYRASLQVVKDPSALVGLAATGVAETELGTGNFAWDARNESAQLQTLTTTVDCEQEIVEYSVLCMENGDEKEEENDEMGSLMSRVVLEPNRAEHWVELAMQNLQSGNLASAHASTQKAMLIMNTQLTEPPLLNKDGSVRHPVSAEKLSDSLVLDACLSKQRNGTSNTTKLNLQKARLICPWNPVAQEVQVI